eukprot:6084398-Prymnesium_polylepis.1
MHSAHQFGHCATGLTNMCLAGHRNDSTRAGGGGDPAAGGGGVNRHGPPQAPVAAKLPLY